MNKDLHCHCAPYSTCATQSIDELLLRAKEGGIRTLSITNHDTTKDENLFEKRRWRWALLTSKALNLEPVWRKRGLDFQKA